MATVDELLVRLDADVSPLSAALRRAEQLIKGFSKTAEQDLDVISQRLQPAVSVGPRGNAVGQGFGVNRRRVSTQEPPAEAMPDVIEEARPSAAAEFVNQTIENLARDFLEIIQLEALMPETSAVESRLNSVLTSDAPPEQLANLFLEFEANARRIQQEAQAAIGSDRIEKVLEFEQEAQFAARVLGTLRGRLTEFVDTLQNSESTGVSEDAQAEIRSQAQVLANALEGIEINIRDSELRDLIREDLARAAQVGVQTLPGELSPDFGPIAPPEPPAMPEPVTEEQRDACACLEALFERTGLLNGSAEPAPTDGPSRENPGTTRFEIEPFRSSTTLFFAPPEGSRTDAQERQLALAQETTEAVDAQSRAWQGVIDKVGEAEQAIVETERATVDVDKVARDLGFTFASAFEDAVVNGESFGDILEGLERDILRILTRTLLTEPIAAGIQGGITGGAPGQGGLESILNGLFSPLSALFGGGGTDVGFGSNVGLPPGTRSFAGLTVGGSEDAGATAALAEGGRPRLRMCGEPRPWAEARGMAA